MHLKMKYEILAFSEGSKASLFFIFNVLLC